MKIKFPKKIITCLILMMFTVMHSASLAVLAEAVNISKHYPAEEKPVLRSGESSSMQLKADVAITTSKNPVSISLRDSDVTQVLRMFADKAGLNIIFEGDIKGKVTLDLVNVPLNEAFGLVMETSKLSYVVEHNTLIVSSSDSPTNIGKQEMSIIPVKYIDAGAMADFLNKNIYGMKKPGLSGTNVVTTNPATNELVIFGTKNDVVIAEKVIAKFDRKPIVTSFKVNHTTPSEMADMICNMLLPSTGSGATGGAAGIVTGGAAASGGGGEIVLGGGTVACSGKAGAGTGDMTSVPLQSLSVSYFTQLGTISLVGGSEQQVEMIKDFIAQNDKKQPQAYLELSIIELNESGSKTLDNTWQFYSKNFSVNYSNGTTRTDPVFPSFIANDKVDIYDPKDPTKPLYTLKKYSGSPTLTYAINYLIENQKGRVVANPRILITNGQESTIDLTSDYVKTVTSQIVQGTMSATAQRDYEIGEDNGLKINITPFISPDGYVTLNINPDYSTIKEKVYSPNDDGSETDLVATLLQRRNLNLKNVRIKDGETLVIGGMIREDETKSVKKIPFFGDIPYLGALFRSTSTTKGKEEMIIMITPKILTDNEDAIDNDEAL